MSYQRALNEKVCNFLQYYYFQNYYFQYFLFTFLRNCNNLSNCHILSKSHFFSREMLFSGQVIQSKNMRNKRGKKDCYHIKEICKHFFVGEMLVNCNENYLIKYVCIPLKNIQSISRQIEFMMNVHHIFI